MKNNSKLIAVIMGGGKGQRLWPRSNSKRPKQFLSLLGKESLIQSTYRRVSSLESVKKNNIFFSIGEIHKKLLKSHFPKKFSNKENEKYLIVEPEIKDTAAALALAALKLLRSRQIKPDDVLFFLPADATISNIPEFSKIVGQAYSAAANGLSIVLLAIKPTRPATGFGYLKTTVAPEKTKSRQDRSLLVVKRFVEKPDASTAKRYLKSSSYFWNSGIFFMTAKFLIEAFNTHAPEHLHTINFYLDLLEKKQTKKAKQEFSKLEKISFDYAIAEKLSGNTLAIASDFGWDDLGGYHALHRLLPKDSNNNATSPQTKAENLSSQSHSKQQANKTPPSGGKAAFFESHNNYVDAGKKTIVLNHVENLTVVVEGDTVVISSVEGQKSIKKLLSQLKNSDKSELL